MSFSLTDEQQAIIDAFATGTNGVVNAYAGSGKTFCAIEMAKSTDRRGIIITYNKDAQLDAAAKLKKAGIKHVTARTAHSLAYASHGAPMAHRFPAPRGKAPRITGKDAARILGVTETLNLGQDSDGQSIILEREDIARLAQQAVRFFCHGSDSEISAKHVPTIPGTEDQRDKIVQTILPYAIKAWNDISSPRGRLSFTDDYYLKQWALTNPVIRVQWIVLDEAQDANPIISNVVNKQKCQKVMVGDRYQAIYEWRGAIDAMTSFDHDWNLPLTQSWRFGQTLADEANKWLSLLGATDKLRGNPAIETTLEALDNPSAILCRTNATCIAMALTAIEKGQKVALAGGVKKVRPLRDFILGANDLLSGKHSSHPDLVAFANWDEVEAYSKQDEGSDLRVWVRLINTYGVGELLDVCDQLGKEEDADVVISTAHSAKGREWSSVLIADDFKAPEEDKPLSASEAMLIYVSVTRARHILDCSAVSWINNLIPALV